MFQMEKGHYKLCFRFTLSSHTAREDEHLQECTWQMVILLLLRAPPRFQPLPPVEIISQVS